MKKILLISVCCLLVCGAAFADENYLSFDITAYLIVYDVEKTQEAILSWVRENGGYYLVRSDDYLQLRFPSGKVPEFTELLEAQGEELDDISQSATDIREELLAHKSAIKSREEALSKNKQLFDRADISATLAIEKEIMALVKEIEEHKAALRKLELNRETAKAAIYFTFKKSSVPEDLSSSFSWINSIDMYSFLKQEALK